MTHYQKMLDEVPVCRLFVLFLFWGQVDWSFRYSMGKIRKEELTLHSSVVLQEDVELPWYNRLVIFTVITNT